MAQKIIAFVCGLVAWILVASLLDRLLRVGLSGYAAAAPAMAFTLSMKWARLAEGALASLSAGFVIARVAPQGRRLPLILGVLVLVAFLPVHYNLWDKFPIWYHLVFLFTIVPLVLVGARIGAPKTQQ